MVPVEALLGGQTNDGRVASIFCVFLTGGVIAVPSLAHFQVGQPPEVALAALAFDVEQP
jgi:hypothetical protein